MRRYQFFVVSLFFLFFLPALLSVAPAYPFLSEDEESTYSSSDLSMEGYDERTDSVSCSCSCETSDFDDSYSSSEEDYP